MNPPPFLAFDPPPLNDPDQDRKWLRQSVERLDRFLNNPDYEDYWRTHGKRQVRADWVNLLAMLPRLTRAMILFDLERSERLYAGRSAQNDCRGDPEGPEMPALILGLTGATEDPLDSNCGVPER